MGSGGVLHRAEATPKSGIGVFMGGGFPWYTNSTISLTNFFSLSWALTAGKGPKTFFGSKTFCHYRLANLRSGDEKKASFSLCVWAGSGASFDLHVRMTSQVFQHTAIAENAADKPPVK